MHADDGIVLRLPDADLMGLDLLDVDPAGQGAEFDADQSPVGAADVVFDKGEVEQLVTDQVGGSALFASRFRECAARALLLPRRDPGRRTPLWQQRQRATQLLQVASEFGSFPIVLEAVRECLQDVFDVPGLVELMGDIESRKVRLVEVTTPEPSPFAKSLLFGYVAQFLYEGDSPLPSVAQRRSRWTPGCWRSSWARPSCANCSTPRSWWSWSASCSGSPRNGGSRAPRASPTCCGCWARWTTPSWPPAGRNPAGRPGWRGRAGRSGSASRAWNSGRPWRTPGGCGTPWEPRCRSVCRRPSPSPSRTPWPICWPATPVPTGRSPRPRPPVASAWAPPSPTAPCTGSPRPAGSSRASSGRAARATSGATPVCCAGFGGARWRRCGTSWNPCRRPPWPPSCRSGSTWAHTACAASTAWCGPWSSSRARRSPPRPWRSSSCPPGWRTTPRRCWTSSPRRARSCGRGPAHCRARTAGCRSTSPTPRPCCCLSRSPWSCPRCTARSWTGCRAATGCSSGRSPSRSAPPGTRCPIRNWPRWSGSWPGPAG